MAAEPRTRRMSFARSAYSSYIAQLSALNYAEISCSSCGAATKSANGQDGFCNFCESFTSTAGASSLSQEIKAVLAHVHELAKSGMYEEAAKELEALLKDSSNPLLFYVAANFYLHFSNATYYTRDYNMMGFMEANAQRIRQSLDLTFKWKEYFYKAIRPINDEARGALSTGAAPPFVKFMSEVRLRRLVDAKRTLDDFSQHSTERQSVDYASMVYAVESGSAASQYLDEFLARYEPNAYYYLARYLVKNRYLEEAEGILRKLSTKATIMTLQPLLNEVVSAERAANPEHASPL